MSIKTESNRLFNVYFGENKDVNDVIIKFG